MYNYLTNDAAGCRSSNNFALPKRTIISLATHCKTHIFGSNLILAMFAVRSSPTLDLLLVQIARSF